jgi:hypothetical protein
VVVVVNLDGDGDVNLAAHTSTDARTPAS